MSRIINKIVQRTPIVLAFTPNYFVPACTTLMSVLENSDSRSSYEVICLLTEDLSDDLKERLEQFGGTRIHFSYINLSGKLEDIYIDERYTIAASFRLLLPVILKQYDKVIYLDCDIIVQNDLTQLYETINLEGYYLAGVFEAPLEFQLEYLKKIQINPGYYMNSGFLVMNLALLRRDNMVEKFIEASKVDYLQFPDQDVLNQVCQGRILGLDPFNNAIRTFYLPQYKPNFLKRYSSQQWIDVQGQGNIHYTGGKPWNEYTVQFHQWWKYFFRLPRAIRSEFPVRKSMYILGRFTNTYIGRFIMDTLQRLYRIGRRNAV